MEDPPVYVLMLCTPDDELEGSGDLEGPSPYVVDLARALGRHPGVRRVDVMVPRAEDPILTPGCDDAATVEPLAPGISIVRVPLGSSEGVSGEALWRGLDQLVDRALTHLASEPQLPELLHAHDAAAGYVGLRLAETLGLPLVFTARSLARARRELARAGGDHREAGGEDPALARRIAAEEAVLQAADLVVAGATPEVSGPYRLYERFDPRRTRVIPPGTDLSRFVPPGRRTAEEGAAALLDPYLREPEKPLILSIGTAGFERDLHRLLEAFAAGDLRRLANLALVCGCRREARRREGCLAAHRSDLFLDVDRHELWGSVAIPRGHEPEDRPELYRLAARRRGILADVSTGGPFGLILREAAASGLPVIADANGGSRDVVDACGNGRLVDTQDPAALATALDRALTDARQWQRWSRNGRAGVIRAYTWDGHVRRYLGAVAHLLRRERKQVRRRLARQGSSTPRLSGFGRVLVTDIDDTLLGNSQGLAELIAWLEERRGDVLFCVATGRLLRQAVGTLQQWDVPIPDVLITSAGTEIRYGLTADTVWSQHVRYRWRREAVEETLADVPGLSLQPADRQSPFKVSYLVDPSHPPRLASLRARLFRRSLTVRLVLSGDGGLDVLPVRASKGLAIRYLALRSGLSLDRFLVVGSSGDDAEMLAGDTLGVVVGNHTPDLEPLRRLPQVYFARDPHARGILEGIRHYGFAERFGSRDPLPAWPLLLAAG